MSSIVEEFFGLKKTPFGIDGSVGPVLMTPPLRNAADYIDRELAAGVPVLCVAGPSGSGKTSLARVLPKLRAEFPALVIVSGRSERWSDIRSIVASGLGLDRGRLTREAIQATQQERGDLLIVVDDADQLDGEYLERICALPELCQVGDKPALQVLLLSDLVGVEGRVTPPILARLNSPSVHQIESLPLAATHRYIDARLQRAGWYGQALIDEGAAAVLHRLSGGNPRELSLCCMNVLEHAATRGLSLINAQFVSETYGEPAAPTDEHFAPVPGMQPFDNVVREVGESDSGDVLLEIPLTAESILSSTSIDLVCLDEGEFETQPVERPLESIRSVVRPATPRRLRMRQVKPNTSGRSLLWLCLCAILLGIVVSSGRPEIRHFLEALPIEIPFLAELAEAPQHEQESAALPVVSESDKIVAALSPLELEMPEDSTTELLVEVETASLDPVIVAFEAEPLLERIAPVPALAKSAAPPASIGR